MLLFVIFTMKYTGFLVGFILSYRYDSFPTIIISFFNSILLCTFSHISYVYGGIYEFKNGELQTIQQQCAVGISDIVAQINEIGKPVTFLGDGVAVFRDYIEENCQVQHDYAPAHMNKQRAGAVAWLGLQYAKEGRFETAAEHCPDYLRLSQAERERQEMLEKQHTGA